MEHKVQPLKGGNRAVKMQAERKLRMKRLGEDKKAAQWKPVPCHGMPSVNNDSVQIHEVEQNVPP